jgi:YVTN family beta-propeller protein
MQLAILSALALLASACVGVSPSPSVNPTSIVATPRPTLVAGCPAPRPPSYLPWGTSTPMQQTAGSVSAIRSDAPPAFFVLERRSDTVGAPTSVTEAPFVIMGRETYLLWAGTPGSSEIVAWWEEGTGSCHVYHARLFMAGVSSTIESLFAKIIASIPAAFVDASAGKTGLLTDIPLDYVPSSIAVSPFEHRLFVADTERGLSAFDTATNRLLDRMGMPMTGGGPVAITLVPGTNRVYVTDTRDNEVLVVDGSTLAVLATVGPIPAPVAIVSDPKANRIYVASAAGHSALTSEPGPGAVTVIDGTTNVVVASVVTRGDPVALDVDPILGRLYVAARGLPGDSSLIQVIDLHTNTELATIGVSPPSALIADPVDKAVYAVSPSAGSFGSKWIEFDSRTNQAATFVDGPGDARVLAWHPGSDDRFRRVYVASQSDVGGVLHIFRASPGTTRLREAGVVRVGADPVAVAVNGASHLVYVASAADRIVSVVLQGPG